MIKKLNESEYNFYFLMGKFFGDRKIIKEMDCQIYNEAGMDWFIHFNKEGAICGFCSIEERKDHYYLDNFYVVPSERNKGIGNELLSKVIEEYNNIQLISRNPIAISMFKSKGFIEFGAKKGRYVKLVLNNASLL